MQAEMILIFLYSIAVAIAVWQLQVPYTVAQDFDDFPGQDFMGVPGSGHGTATGTVIELALSREPAVCRVPREPVSQHRLGDVENIAAAQQALPKRARLNDAMLCGEYDPDSEVTN